MDAPPTPLLTSLPAWRRPAAIVLHPRVQQAILVLIVLNALILGAETVPALGAWMPLLASLDGACLAVFTAELLLKMLALGRRFWRDPWNLFDVVVVGIALLPASGPLAVLRTLRVLRVLRLVSSIPALRRVVEALLRSLPGMGAIVAVQGLVIYVAGVMAVGLFGATDPAHFGHLGAALLTLFQVTTVEGWPDIARGLMEQHPWAWLFFLIFLVVSTFVMLNLFIAVIGNAMQDVRADEQAPAEDVQQRILAELRELRREIAALRERAE